MKEPYVTTYKEKYRVIRNRRLKQSVPFYVVNQDTISFLLDYLKTLLGLWFVKSLLRMQCVSTLYNHRLISNLFISRNNIELSMLDTMEYQK